MSQGRGQPVTPADPSVEARASSVKEPAREPAHNSDRKRMGTLLRGRHALITVNTTEEDRALEAVVGGCIDQSRHVYAWSVVRGVYEGAFDTDHVPQAGTEQPAAALRWCWQAGADQVFVFCDLVSHLENEVVVRALRELITRATTLGSTVVLIDHRDGLPEIIQREAMPFAPSLPDDQELLQIIRATVDQLKTDKPIAVDLSKELVRAAVKALRGLTRSQARRLVAEAMAEDDRFDARDVEGFAAARARLLGSNALLEAVDAGADDVAGAGNLKAWLDLRRTAIDAPASSGLDIPRGVLLLGVPGSGKSLCAKTVARWWRRPLLRLDVGSLYDRYIGESERRLRGALRQAEAMAPAVLWIDEIEKAFASAASQSTDGGLSQRMFGCLLTWMQERTAAVFVVATANDIAALPPELLRKGRFDEIFFVDLPSAAVRRDIARIHLARRRLDPAGFDLEGIAADSDGCTGADIEAAIASAALTAHAEGRAAVTADVVKALGESAPLARVMPERIAALRAWQHGRCRLADS
jgi:SpoVK/Ycf46/Vps4 family AAA+-type ATPase